MKAPKKSTATGGSATVQSKWGPLEIELRQLDPKSLKRREVNARFMSPEQFKRLVTNVKIDGALTEIVLCCQDPDGSVEILSGHHRQEAAIAAGMDLIWAMVIVTPLDEERKTAIQLSHNSIAGEDNPSILAQLYEGLDLEAKKFSGLTDGILKGLNKMQVSALAAANIEYEQLSIQFLPEDLEVLNERMEELRDRLAKKDPPIMLAARYVDFDRIFDAIVRVKHKLAIVNSALALCAMAELAHTQLDVMDEEKQAAESKAA
jgi:ParB-like chromosome segregation protein Spo0J